MAEDNAPFSRTLFDDENQIHHIGSPLLLLQSSQGDLRIKQA